MQTLEQRQGLKVACIEEIAYVNGFIDADQLLRLADHYAKSGYGDYLKQVLAENPPKSSVAAGSRAPGA